MSDERLKVLKMLKEGKITIEQAELLLEAVERQKKREFKEEIPDGVDFMSFVKKILSSTLGMVPGVVFSALKGTGEFSETVPVEDISKIELSVSAGDLEVRTSKDNMVHLEGDGRATVKRKGDVLKINIPLGDASLEIPEDMPLYAEIQAGDIEMRDVSFPVKIKAQAGDVEIRYKKLKDLHIEAMAGDVSIKVPKDAGFKLNFNVSMGSYDLPKELRGMKSPIEWGREPYANLNISLMAGDFQLEFLKKE